MGKAGHACMVKMLEYSFDHHDALFLILRRSEGTKYSGMIDELVELEVEGTHNYYECSVNSSHVPHYRRAPEHILLDRHDECRFSNDSSRLCRRPMQADILTSLPNFTRQAG